MPVKLLASQQNTLSRADLSQKTFRVFEVYFVGELNKKSAAGSL
jgi:hypothetical protein